MNGLGIDLGLNAGFHPLPLRLQPVSLRFIAGGPNITPQGQKKRKRARPFLRARSFQE
jgi:hypothetical protein